MPNIDPQNLAASLRRIGATDDDFTGAIDRAVETCVELFGVDGSGLMIADEQNTLHYVASSDGPSRALEEVQSETGQGPCVDTFVHGAPVLTIDLARETRWPASRDAIVAHGVRSVLGVPVHLGGIVVGSLDAYRAHPHEWDESEKEALVSYSTVVEAILRAALAGHHATRLTGQLQYALDNRVLIERAVGFVMGRTGTDAVTAFNTLRSTARTQRRKVADVAREVLGGGNGQPVRRD
ncbi:GAF and ANTAR domain-containing protein [Pseudonocardia lacus]|uniref:GAF and ANTAR domain-containing protein n=1 Tax=Pseudonocardia lacus TaxID=2835865 RepID=UPI001BDBF450|nr:GAF and ANTAR domain-containing protein [Pseudonocardia lacus]